MRLLSMLAHYVWWHYTTAIVDLVRNYLNVAAFLRHFFSLNHLARNLFTPWRRLGEEYPMNSLDLQGILATFIVNTLMRLVGFVVRSVMIAFGLISLCLSLVVFFIVLFVWLFIPFILVFLLVFGYKLLSA